MIQVLLKKSPPDLNGKTAGVRTPHLEIDRRPLVLGNKNLVGPASKNDFTRVLSIDEWRRFQSIGARECQRLLGEMGTDEGAFGRFGYKVAFGDQSFVNQQHRVA